MIGVAAAVVKHGQNLNFALPVNHLAKLMKQTHSVKPLSKVGGAEQEKKSVLQQHESEVAEGLVAYGFDGPDLPGDFSFVVKNNLDRPVKNVRWLVVVYDKKGRPLDFDSGETPHGSLFTLKIPPKLAKPVEGSIDSNICLQVESADMRILSFEVIEERKSLDDLLFE